MIHKCPKCGAGLILLPSKNQKLCSNYKCGKVYNWKLEEGQKSPWIDGKVGGVE